MQGSKVLASAAKAASYNMVLQFGLRSMTFILNAFIIRHISQETLGIVNVRLTLLYSTTLFLAKEAFERACLSKTEGRDWKQVINLLWCTLPLAIVCSTVLGLIWLYLLDIPPGGSYTIGVVCFALSTVIEVLAEPLYVTGQAYLFVKLKVVFLGLSQAVKCIVTIVLVIAQPQWGLVSFSIAQVLSSIVYVLLYQVYFIRYIRSNQKKDDDFPLQSVRDIFPQKVEGKPFIDPQLKQLTVSFFTQSFLKQILTEGEKFVMTFFNVLSFSDQGVYDVVNNLGSLAARFLFLPIEENSYLFFSQMLTRGSMANDQKPDSLKLCAKVLGVILKLVTLIGAIILVFGFSNSYLALYLYGGAGLSSGSGPVLLRWYCMYVLFIAVNGVTEAFVFAAMSKQDVDRFNLKMLLFSALFLLSSLLLTRLFGSVGFILANCLNIGARIIHSIFFIIRYFSNTEYHPLKEILPSSLVIVTLVISLLTTAVSEYFFCYDGSTLNKVLHIGVSFFCLMSVMAAIFLTEKTLISTVKEQLSRSRQSSKPEEKTR